MPGAVAVGCATMGDVEEVTRTATVAAEPTGQETAVVEAMVTVMPAVDVMAGEESPASPSAEPASASREVPGEEPSSVEVPFCQTAARAN